MAMKPFEIQSADLKLGGVTLQAGNTGVVIPGVTQATSYRVEEIDDTGDQDRTFLSAPMVIDYVTAQDLNSNGTTSNRATFVVELEDDGKIDGIEVDSEGSYTSQESAQNSSQNMLAYIGSDSDPLVNWNFQDWATIPFSPKMRAGEVERIGGDGGADLKDLYVNDTANLIDDGTGNFVNFNVDGDEWMRLGTYNNQKVQVVTGYDGNDNVWEFTATGDLKLPAGGTIMDANGNSVLGGGGGNSLAPFVTINEDDKVSITTDIIFASEAVSAAGYVISTFDPNNNDDSYFEAATADSDGVMYTVGYFYNGPGYALIYATNPDGSSKWRTGLDQINGNTPRPNNVVYKNGYVYVGFKYYDNNEWQVGVAKLNANDGSLNDRWTLTSPQNSYPSLLDIAIDNNDTPILVGQINNEKETISGITAQTGSGLDKLVVNTIDLLPSGETNVGNIQWEIDTTGAGVWAGPNEINAFYDLPVTTVTGSGSGMTVNLRYSGGHPTQIWINQQGSGYGIGQPDYQFGDTLKILGSTYGGVDGVNDITFYSWNYNGGSSYTINVNDWAAAGVCPTDKTYFTMSGGVDYSQNGPWNFRYSLNSQAYIWTPNWQHSYGSGSNSEEFTSVAYNDIDGSIYIGGDFYQETPRRSNAVYKLDSNGNTVWAKYVEDSNSLGGQDFGTVALDGTGNVFVVMTNNDGKAVITKLDSDGIAIWSVIQTNEDGNNYWNNAPRGAVDSNGDVYITGSWTWDDNRYGLSMVKLSGADGSLVWARKLNTTDDQDLYEFYDNDTQPFKIVGNNIYYAGYTYDANGNRNVGYALCVPTDGSGTGTYGRWKYEEDATYGFTNADIIFADGVFGATDGASQSNDSGVYVNLTTDNYGSLTNLLDTFAPAAGGTLEQVGSITFSDGTVQTTAAGGAVTWTNPNDNVWRIEEYNSGAAVQYWGNDYDAKWFDISNYTSGSNNFRGAIIQYHAFIQNRGTIIGTIHLANDYTVEQATHTEHMSGGSDLQYVTLWDTNNERGQLFFKMTNGQNWSAMIQWKSTVFYGSENNC